MDYIRAFDVELDRTVYYPGEMLTGSVYLEVEENMRMQNIKVFLRGKAHAEWKITRAGERRTVKQDEPYIDQRMMLWGKEDDDFHQGIPILTRGRHSYPFNFQLPDLALPCSFESKIGTIRYYVRVNLNIPYASCPQCIRYFTIIGPHIDCMDERFLSPVSSMAKKNACSLCCGKGPLMLRVSLDRTSFVCGEQIKLKAEVQNGSDSEVWVLCKIIQYVEFFINKGVLGLSKEVRHTVLEAESDKVPAHDSSHLDELTERLVIPIMPPTMIDVCGLVQIYYTLKLYLETSKGKGDAAEISLPITIATVPFRIPNGPMPDIHYEMAAPNVEGGMYISPEFQLGQVYMGDEVDPETDQTILYHPVYVCVTGECPPPKADAHLLQVPTRQTSRSRENVSASEALLVKDNVSSTYSVQQQQVKFHVPGETEVGSSATKKPEDKFLKEITAKIASRHVQGQNGEEGGTYGLVHDDGSNHQSTIDAKMEIMKEQQRKSKDNVHKALVNELRRHLSEGDDGSEVEKVPPSLKKPGLKKMPAHSYSLDLERNIKNDTGKIMKQLPEVANKNAGFFKDLQEEATSVRHDAGISNVHLFSSTCIEKTDESLMETGNEELDEDVECSELSALLSTSPESSQKYINKRVCAPSHQDVSADYTMPMQQSTENISPDHAEVLLSQSLQLVRKSEDNRDNADIHGSSLSVAKSGKSVRVVSSPHRIVDNITPAAVAATVTCAAPAAADPAAALRAGSPKVAPKPHKDRHSFPAVHSPQLECPELSVEIVRPKSEIVDKLRQDQHRDDSSV